MDLSRTIEFVAPMELSVSWAEFAVAAEAAGDFVEAVEAKELSAEADFEAAEAEEACRPLRSVSRPSREPWDQCWHESLVTDQDNPMEIVLKSLKIKS